MTKHHQYSTRKTCQEFVMTCGLQCQPPSLLEQSVDTILLIVIKRIANLSFYEPHRSCPATIIQARLRHRTRVSDFCIERN